ncbi:putative ribonuclease H-like domain-containing protein [Tanacetum coccineum]|uniref:Ribonuclease H-like domain-containing protein n=1 Tax=Tanacetum coccineum TaxID=301880 RepID=A0ABQ5HTX6_9ASTR
MNAMPAVMTAASTPEKVGHLWLLQKGVLTQVRMIGNMSPPPHSIVLQDFEGWMGLCLPFGEENQSNGIAWVQKHVMMQDSNLQQDDERRKCCHALEDIVYSDDDEDVGAEADMNNLDAFMQEVYVCQPLGFEDLDFPDRVYKVEKALYGLHQAPRAWYETLSTYLLNNGFQRGKIPTYTDSDYAGQAWIGSLQQEAKIVNEEVQLQALVDGKKVILTESTLTLIGYEKVSQKLTFYKAFFSPQWKFLIHTVLQCLSAKTTIWNEFSSTMASTIICLDTNQKFNFSKYIFESMVKNLENVSGKFLMYPRFVQVFLEKQLEGM